MPVGYGEWLVTQSDDEPANLAATRHREHELVEHLPDGVAVLDVSGGIAWANERLGRTQRLAGLQWLDELPRSSIGKVLKRELRERWLASGVGVE